MTDRCVPIGSIGSPEADLLIAALLVGLDSGMGVLHADMRARDSLAGDLTEPVRPKVDGLVLDLLTTHTFAARDVFETRQGACRLMPAVTARLAEMVPTLATWIGPVAEDVARALFQPERRHAERDRLLPTILTQANRRAGRDGVRREPTRGEPVRAAVLPRACADCGTVLGDPERRYCDDCLPIRRRETVESFSATGPEALALLRANGRDPAHGGEAARKRGRRNAEHIAAVAHWERERRDVDETDADEFARDILPKLKGVPLSVMAEATGLSLGYCSFVRNGRKVPHRRHWGVLSDLSAVGEEYER